MTVAWLMYSLLISLLLAPAAWLLDRGVHRLRLPTRWVWLGGLALSLALPVEQFLPEVEGTPAGTPAELATLEASNGPGVAPGEVGGREDSPSAGFLALLQRGRQALDQAVASGMTLFPEGPTVERWIGAVWGVASGSFALVLLSSMVRLRVRVRDWPRETLRGRAVRVAPDFGPATVGPFRPAIVVPRWARELAHDELELVLVHEEEHARSRDPLLRFAGLLPLIAFPWNPMIWWQLKKMGEAVEIDCDRRVLRRGVTTRRYGNLLLAIGSRSSRDLLPVPGMSGSPSLLERRLGAMTRMRRWTAIPGSLAMALVAAGLILAACGTEAPPTNQEEVNSEAATPVGLLGIRVDRDGTIHVNGETHPITAVSDLASARDTASDDRLVVSIEADPDVPYRVISDLKDELTDAGIVRVVFASTDASALPSSQNTVEGAVDRGLALALPEGNEGRGIEVDGRNVLHLEVQPSGAVEVRRGVSPQFQQFRLRDVDDIWREEVARSPNLIAALKTHPEAPFSSTLQVLDALYAANATRISLQTLESDTSAPADSGGDESNG